MAVKICPECGGKVAQSRNECIHCGHVFKQTTKKCPECEADVDINVTECPECGHYFVKPNKEEKQGAAVGVAAAVVGATSAASGNASQTQIATQKAESKFGPANVTCSSCGSNDCEQLDDYTYRCRNCSSIIKVKKPDVNVYNINSFGPGDGGEDVPIYQVIKNLTEEEFAREVVIFLAHESKVSPTFLENFKLDKSMVNLAYVTYITKEYQVDIAYSCEIGFEYEVKYYQNGSERTKTEVRWEPFSGTSTDGGTTILSAYGDETKIDSFIPTFYADSYEFEEFKESDRYPLKRRADRSCEEYEKQHRIGDLEYKVKDELPGDKNRNFKSNGRCILSEAKAYYYVPAYSLTAQSNDHEVSFCKVANKEGSIRFGFAESVEEANQGDRTSPEREDGKKIFVKTSFGKVSLVCVIVMPILLAASVVLAIVLHSWLYMIGAPIYLGVLIAVLIMRSKTIDMIWWNLRTEFKQEKLQACKKCLENNGLAPLTEEEEEEVLW